MLAVSIVREAASLTTQINGEVIPSDKPGQLSMGMREPVGVILGIAPWNAPIILGDQLPYRWLVAIPSSLKDRSSAQELTT